MTEMHVKTHFNQLMALNFEQAKLYRDKLEADYKATGDVLNAYPKNAMGLTLPHIKETSEWRGNYRWNQLAHQRLRAFNQKFVKTFKKELAAERKAKRAS